MLLGGDCPAEMVPEKFLEHWRPIQSRPLHSSDYFPIFVMENLQQTAEQVRLNTAGVIQAICSALGRHPVKIDW